jgi:hypothetical protein
MKIAEALNGRWSAEIEHDILCLTIGINRVNQSMHNTLINPFDYRYDFGILHFIKNIPL